MADFKHIKGFDELQKMLDTLPAKMEANIMRGALRAGAKEIEPEVKQNIPVASGDLRDSVRVSTRSKRGVVTASVKIGNKKAWYAHIIEYTGAVPHNIAAKGKGVLAFAGFVGKSVMHPGMKAKPFARPALDSKAEAAIQATGEYIKKRLTKQGLNTAGIDIEVEK
jgi:HK97 gp10 family phage protein